MGGEEEEEEEELQAYYLCALSMDRSRDMNRYLRGRAVS